MLNVELETAQRLLQADGLHNRQICGVALWDEIEGVVALQLQHQNDIAWQEAWLCAACLATQYDALAMPHAWLHLDLKGLLLADQARTVAGGAAVT
jgi:hypothetical protein